MTMPWSVGSPHRRLPQRNSAQTPDGFADRVQSWPAPLPSMLLSDERTKNNAFASFAPAFNAARANDQRRGSLHRNDCSFLGAQLLEHHPGWTPSNCRIAHTDIHDIQNSDEISEP